MIWNKTRNHYPDRLRKRITEAKANRQLHDVMKKWRDEYVALRDNGAVGLYDVKLTGDYMQDGTACCAAVLRYRYEQELRAAEPQTITNAVHAVYGEAVEEDPRERRRADILTALKDDPINMAEAMELFDELATLDVDLQIHPSDALNDKLAYGWRFVEEVKF